MRRYIAILALAVLMIGCAQGGGDASTVNIGSNPFQGGTQGLVMGFQDFRAEVFDGGLDPFDIIVRLENEGETLVPKNKVRVTLSGINPSEFSRSEADLTSTAPDDVIEKRKQSDGSIIDSPPSFVEFTEFNHRKTLTGSTAQFTIRADACYEYKTRAVTKLCVRKDLLTPQEGGICEVNANKQTFNSGSPVHIQNFKESTRSKEKVGFTFEVVNVGTGDVFERNANCDREDRRKENRVYLKIDTGLSGLQCTGLSPTATGAEGWATLYSDRKIISCSQFISNMADYEQLVNIEATYDYEQSIQNTLTVKTAGE